MDNNFRSIVNRQKDILTELEKEVKNIENSDLTKENAQLKFELEKQLPILKQAGDTNWLSEVYSLSLTDSLSDLNSAFSNFFKNKFGFPKFKKKTAKQSFKVRQGFKIIGNRLY